MTEEVYKLIKSLGEDNFKQLVKEYNRLKYSTWDVNLVDGPYDGGIDLVVRVNEKEIKRNVQITVQERQFDTKLLKDLGKASENIDNFSYMREMQFYCPYKVTKLHQNKLESEAEIKYGVNLSIIDGWKMAEDCSVFEGLKPFVYKLHDVKVSYSTRVTKEEKVIFDYLALSKDSVEVKKRFVQFYILSFLQDNPGSTLDDIVKGIASGIGVDMERRLIENQVSNLLTNKRIIKNKERGEYCTSEEEGKRLDNILTVVNVKENEVISEFEVILNEYGCSELVDDVFMLIRKIYQVGFGAEADELNHKLSTYEKDIKGLFKELEEFFDKKGVCVDSKHRVIYSLIDASRKNDYFSKVSASSLYASLFQNNKLDRYIGEKDIFACLDTQILLRYICVKYRSLNDYSDKSYNATKNMMECVANSNGKINIFTTEDYVGECVSHLWAAVKLDRFTKLEYVKKLGPSKNVFYNFYIHLADSAFREFATIADFIDDIVGVDIAGLSWTQFESQASRRLMEILDMTNLKVESHPQYPELFSIKREYELDLASNRYRKTMNAIVSDVRTAVLLGQEDRFINESGVYSEPFLITWDSSFQYLRDIVYQSNKLSSWHLYVPSKFVDHIYVMNFKVDPENVGMNIASLIDEDFNTSSKFNSFFDIISLYFDRDDIGEIPIARQLVEIKERTFNYKEEDRHSHERDFSNPLTDILLDIRKHYKDRDVDYSFDDVIDIFEDESYEKPIVNLLIKTLEEQGGVEDIIQSLDKYISTKKSRPSNT
ncbi:hypothetical protein [Hahella sp. NBU794]|uniref:hypothetical protein n=1 Tax=Hahella sp. NBU794 TaxID=3422590 RepID=UPI003D6EA6DA